MRKPEIEAAPDLCKKAARMDDRSDVANAEHIYESDAACFDVDFDLGETDHERIGGAIARMVVLGYSHQTQTGERGRGPLGHRIDVFRDLMAVVLAAQLKCPFAGLRVSHATRRGAATINSLSADLEVVGRAAQVACGNLPQFALRVHRPCIIRAGHRMGRLAANRETRPRQVLASIAPYHLD